MAIWLVVLSGSSMGNPNPHVLEYSGSTTNEHLIYLYPTPATTTTTTTTGFVCNLNYSIDDINFEINEYVSCGDEKIYSGSFVYPYIIEMSLGTSTGTLTLTYDAYSLPELYMVYYNNNLVINTGFRGHVNFDYGGSLRYSVVNTLNGSIDPINGGTLPNFTNYPDDGYPRITSPGNGSVNFSKNSTESTAIVKIYSAVLDITQWEFTLSCPV